VRPVRDRSLGWRATRHRAASALLALWCLLWLGLGVLTGRAVWQLTELGDGVRSSGLAVDEAGQALQELGDLPVVGGTASRVAGEVRERAGEVVARGEQTRGAVQRVALVLGVAVAVLPTAPLLALSLPARLRFQRDVRAVREAMATEPPDAVEAYLAGRALAHLPLPALRRYTPTPLADARDGRHAALAAAELARLGLSRTDRGASEGTD
jgi:hypothetical protein